MEEKKVALDKEAQNDRGVVADVASDLGKGGLHGRVLRDGLPVHPVPTTDALDPLNWSSFRKHTILAVVICKYFLFTYITTTTVPSFAALQEQFNITYSQVNWTVAIPALGLSVGPVIWSSLADTYGRRLIFVIGTVMALGATIGAAKTPSYGGYMAARFFQGLGVSPGATVGLATINDMFFEHERGQKIGLWVLAIDSGLLVGPIFGGFLNVVSAAWIQWFTAILFGVLLLLELAVMPETLYPRRLMLTIAPPAESSELGHRNVEKKALSSPDPRLTGVKRTKDLPFINVKPVPGMRHPKVWDSALRTLLMFKFPAIVLAVLTFCFGWYWWVLSVITMLPAAYPQYTPLIQGLLFIGLLLGTLFAEVALGGRLSDAIVRRLAHKNGGTRIPEMRMWMIYPAGVLTAVGLIVWGVSIDKGYHWIVGQIALFLFAAGIQMGNTAICSYIVDVFPLQSMSVITFYSVFLNLSAFIDPFFIAPWQAGTGWTWCFTAQGLIVLFAALPVLGALHYFGSKLRASTGVPAWTNPEYDDCS